MNPFQSPGPSRWTTSHLSRKRVYQHWSVVRRLSRVKLEPRQIRQKEIKVLNSISGSLMDSISKLKLERDDAKWVIKTL